MGEARKGNINLSDASVVRECKKVTAKHEPVKGMITASLSPKTVLNAIVVAHTIIICGVVDSGHHCCHTQDSEFEQSN